MIMKKCSKCGEIKNVSEFHKDRSRKDGLNYKCKECEKQYCKSNKKVKAEYDKLYRKCNKERIVVKNKQLYQKNKKDILDKGKQYYKDNKITIAKKHKLYHNNNKKDCHKREKQYRMSNAKYDLFVDKLTVDESPRLHSDGISLEVKCKYCGKYFIPNYSCVMHRVKTLNGEYGVAFLYCSDNCKQACPIYGMRKYPRGFKHTSSREVNSLVRQMVFERDNWTCQICGRTIKEVQLHCHHMDPVAQNPMFQNDIDSCITLCKDCHKTVHRQYGCRYVDLQCKQPLPIIENYNYPKRHS